MRNVVGLFRAYCTYVAKDLFCTYLGDVEEQEQPTNLDTSSVRCDEVDTIHEIRGP